MTTPSTSAQGPAADAAEFLIERLNDFESEIGDDAFREWAGHVHPAMARLTMALRASPASAASPSGVDAVAIPKWVYTSACAKFEGDSNRIRAWDGSIHAGWEESVEFETAEAFYAWAKAECDRRNAYLASLTSATPAPTSGSEAGGDINELASRLHRSGIDALKPADWPLLVEVLRNAAEGTVTSGPVSAFGHHPDPSTDFCCEVEMLEGWAEDVKAGTRSQWPFWGRLSALRRFINSDAFSGLDSIAQRAKASALALEGSLTAPSPAGGVREAAKNALDYLTVLYNAGEIDGQVGGEIMSDLAAALAPATEGRKS